MHDFYVNRFFSIFLKRLYLFLFLERGKGREKEGEKYQYVRDTLISCFSHALNWGPGLQPRPVP